MKINITFKKLFFFVLLSLVISQKSVSQCFQIESILVDACSATDEGKNEMVRFKIGPTAQNVNNLVVVWPNNAWQGLIQDANTAAKVALINQDIDDANGCGDLLEPAGGVLPANAKVILVTSQLFDVTANPFGALTENTYILFQDNLTTSAGHFANYSTSGSPLRTLTMNFGACSDAVTYSRILLTNQAGNNAAADGATVNFNANGDATYINNGCAAPVLVSTVDAGNATANACDGATITLNGSATGQTSVTWSAPSGTFTDANSLTTDYQITAPVGTVVILTLTAYNGLCTITDTVELTVKPIITPDFATTLTVCNGASAPALNNTSPNGIVGTWNPAIVSNSIGATYTFTPTAGQCANPTQVVVTIDNFCAFGSFASAVKLKKSINCTTQTEEFYNTSGSGLNLIAPVANDFNNSFLGVYQKNSSNLILKGGQIKTFKSTGANVCGVKLKYRVYLTSSIGTTFSQIECPFYDNCVGGSFPTLGPCNPGDQKWEEIGNNLDLTTYAPGNYTIELFYEVNGDNNSTSACNDTQIVNNSGVNFKANFTIQNTPLYTGNNPITCNGSDGSITVSGLSPNTNYSLTYSDDAVVVGPSVFTTNANGNILISNLNAGNYNNFNLNINGCDYQIDFLPPVVLVNPVITPTFTAVAPICAGATLSPLSITSLEGITGIWSPALNNNATTNYVFTAGVGQCAVNGNLTITVTPATQPTFTAVAPICAGATLSPLPTTSLEGITGTWSPALNNNATTNYVFTIDAGQCALNGNLTITVTPATQPTFTAIAPICAGTTLSPLPTASLEGITGIWSPPLNNNATTNYVFTSGAGQCALNGSLTITVDQVTQPTFTAVASICAGATISPLPSTSLEGITGTWSPALNNNATTNYVFTSGLGQCALNGNLTITVNPDFDLTIKNECINGDFTLIAEPVNNSYDPSIADYKWKDTSGNTIGTNDATLNVTSLLNMTPSTETFPITYFLTITSQEGCVKTNTGFVVNDVICKIPKGISPGVVDGKNDSFDLTGFNVEKIEIFNRYGTEVFSYGAYTDQWHGQASGGEDLPDGTYFYVINRKGGITTTGWIYINRQY